MEDLWRGVEWALGLGQATQALGFVPMSLRAILIYLVGWAILRFGGNRFLGRQTAFDIVLGFILGSTLSRAINGTAPVFVTVAASALLVAVHQGLAWLTWRSHRVGALLKGSPDPLIEDGKLVGESLRRHLITAGDLAEAFRLNGHVADPDQVQEARIERNGDISIVQKRWRPEPRILEVAVRDGVQTIRIELG